MAASSRFTRSSSDFAEHPASPTRHSSASSTSLMAISLASGTEHQDEKHPDNEINPDVLGYIFEKYINQKQMGAYYTKEDITEYIGKNTILPFTLEQARSNCKVAFAGAESEVWRLLQRRPRPLHLRAGTARRGPRPAAGDRRRGGRVSRGAAAGIGPPPPASRCRRRRGASMWRGARAASSCARSWRRAS